MKTGIFNLLKKMTAAAVIAAMLSVGNGVSAAEISVPMPVESRTSVKLSNPVQSVTVGDEAYVRVELEDENTAGGMSGLYGYEFELEYDSAYLTYKSADSGISGGQVTAEVKDGGRVKLMFCKTDESASIGSSLATVRFAANRSGAARVSVKSAAMINSDMEYVERDGLDESVTITIGSRTQSSSSGGGVGGGGLFTSSGTNSVTSVSQTMEPIDPNAPTAEPEIFSDLSGAEWAIPAIADLYALGIINGYEDGGFHPNDNVTRAEFCKIAVTALGIALPESGSDTGFKDAGRDEWYAPYVKAAADLEIINGYEDGTFKPDNDISREEASAIICRAAEALDINLNSKRLNINFKDENEIQDIFVGYVDKLYTAGIINGDDDGSFRPNDSLSRAETAQLVENLLIALRPEPTANPEETADPGQEPETPLAGRKHKDAEAAAEEPSETLNPEETANPDETAEPDATADPEETADPNETAEPETTKEPEESFEPDAVYDCKSLDELYSYVNLSAYEVPDDGSRDAFYDDFTTFQRSAAGDAEAVYRIPYAERVRVVSYFYAGEPLTDLTFETSKDGKTWSAAECSGDHLTAEGKWTRAIYRFDISDDEPFVKIVFPKTLNSWTPVVSEVSAVCGSARAAGLKIDGDDSVVVPRYDSRSFKYEAYLIDQIGERFKPAELSVKDSEIPDLNVSLDGTVEIKSEYPAGAKFTLSAEAEGFSAEKTVTLEAALLGDADGSGAVDSADLEAAVAAYDKLSGGADWKDVRECDINSDGKISVIDIAYISRKAGGENERAVDVKKPLSGGEDTVYTFE